MGRKSLLTPEQWVEVERRVFVGGESVNSIAKELGINEAAIRRKINPNKSEAKSLKELAIDKFKADQLVRNISEQISELPMSRQNIVNDLSRKLCSVSEHLTGAAEFGAMTAHRLSMIANQQVSKLDETATLEENTDTLKSVMAMTKGANDAAQIGTNLLNANKDALNTLPPPMRTINPEALTIEQKRTLAAIKLE